MTVLYCGSYRVTRGAEALLTIVLSVTLVKGCRSFQRPSPSYLSVSGCECFFYNWGGSFWTWWPNILHPALCLQLMSLGGCCPTHLLVNWAPSASDQVNRSHSGLYVSTVVQTVPSGTDLSSPHRVLDPVSAS